jgi:hypothetical protein
MGIPGLPASYEEWLVMRNKHLEQDLQHSHYTDDLFKQYRKHLGGFRYKILLEGQKLVVPQRVNELLKLGKYSLLAPVIPVYKFTRFIKLDWFVKLIILPANYRKQIKALDVVK